jgi:hypothetical protein
MGCRSLVHSCVDEPLAALLPLVPNLRFSDDDDEEEDRLHCAKIRPETTHQVQQERTAHTWGWVEVIHSLRHRGTKALTSV